MESLQDLYVLSSGSWFSGLKVPKTQVTRSDEPLAQSKSPHLVIHVTIILPYREANVK